jgi:hypothetical protein
LIDPTPLSRDRRTGRPRRRGTLVPHVTVNNVACVWVEANDRIVFMARHGQPPGINGCARVGEGVIYAVNGRKSHTCTHMIVHTRVVCV